MVTARSGAGALTTTGPGQRRRSGNGKYFISENISVLKIFQTLGDPWQFNTVFT